MKNLLKIALVALLFASGNGVGNGFNGGVSGNGLLSQKGGSSSGGRTNNAVAREKAGNAINGGHVGSGLIAEEASGVRGRGDLSVGASGGGKGCNSGGSGAHGFTKGGETGKPLA